MSEFVDDLVALCRYFAMFERERICCGTVTVQQCVVLQTLLDGPREIGPLAEDVGSSPSAMTRLVDGLARRGWVERVRAEQDRRCVHVSLTSDGRGEAERLRALTVNAAAQVLGEIPAKKRAQVVESVGLIKKALEDARASLEGCCE